MEYPARRLIACMAAVALSSAPGVAQAADFAVPLGGRELRPLTIDAGLMARLPRQTIETRDHGTPVRIEGVWLRDVLQSAAAPLGEQLRGKHLALVVLLTARDGHRAAFALADFDTAFRDRPILLADRRDGAPLPENEAPLRLVVADEARFGRWIRQIARIDLLDASQLVSSTLERSSRTPSSRYRHPG